MREWLVEHRPEDSIAIVPVAEDTFNEWLKQQDQSLQHWVTGTEFRGKPGSISLVPGRDGEFTTVIAGISSLADPWALGSLPGLLPGGCYFIDAPLSPPMMERLAIGWGLGAYQFTRYKESQRGIASLAIDSAGDTQRIRDQVQAITLVRDLINTPAQDMMPEHLADAMIALAGEFGAQVEQIVGDELLEQNFPAIHAVGRASVHAPRLIGLHWGEEHHPKLTLVGKGVCFDSGGLDLKTATGMRLMKKDMGGAAHALGLARLIMSARLPVRLRVLVPAVENAVSGNAFHPGDVIRSRKGLTIEIDNTDAEGRVILCDALAEGGADAPDLIIDFATLTGAARVALGTEMPALFTNSDEVAADLLEAASLEQDPIWRLPLFAPYRELLDSKIADLANSTSQPFGGAITAALFLQEFVPKGVPWAHVDVMAWNTRSRPGRPEGGEAMGLRAVFRYLSQRYGG